MASCAGEHGALRDRHNHEGQQCVYADRRALGSSPARSAEFAFADYAAGRVTLFSNLLAATISSTHRSADSSAPF
jgi:hypothetical protein